MKKGNLIALIVIIVIVVVGGGFALFHNSGNSNSNSSNNSSSTKKAANAPAVNNAVLVTKTDPALGQFLADPSGKALYTYNADTSGVSNCTGGCLAAWPAYQDTGATTGLPSGVSTIKRTDNGQTQFTYNGKPLYFFASDPNGQVTGNGVENFSVATPAAASSSSNSSNGSSSSSSSDNSSSSGYNY